MHKVGDFITIKKDLQWGYGYVNWVSSEMLVYRGARVRITGINHSSCILLCIDKGKWSWSYDMFER